MAKSHTVPKASDLVFVDAAIKHIPGHQSLQTQHATDAKIFTFWPFLKKAVLKAMFTALVIITWP